MKFSPVLYTFLLVYVVAVTITYANSRIITQDIIYDYLIKIGYNAENANSYFKYAFDNQWIKYLFLPIILVFKTFFATFCISISIYLSGKKVDLNSVIRVVMMAQLVWFIEPLFQLFWFKAIQTQYSLNDIENFYTFSLNDFISKQSALTSFSNLFSLISLYELIYCLFMGYGISGIVDGSFKTYFFIVVRGYGLGSLLIGMLMTFLHIAYS